MPKHAVPPAVRASPLDRVGPCGSTELTTVVGASAGEGRWYLFRNGGTITNSYYSFRRRNAMRLAHRALIAALVSLVLCAAVSAQTLRSPNDSRNQSPSVGTGGPEGGPTGLFTLYDGSTLRKGEFTFSIAYSNYDRDPGNVDFSVIPLSFNVGINDHLELWFSTEGYRGVKVNNPKNLSSFYLPNSQLYFGPGLLGSGPAIIIAPERVSGSTALTSFGSLFRPAFNQTFVQFPFVGGPGPNFGLTGNRIAPPFTSRLGVPVGAEQG